MKFSIQLLENYLKQDIPTIILTLQKQKYVFNMPTVFQRFVKDHKQKFPKGSIIFFTKATTQTLAGLSGFLLTIFDSKFCQDTKLYVSQQLYEFLEQVRYKMGFKILPYSYSNLLNQKTRTGIKQNEKIYELLQKENYAQIFMNSQKYITQNLKTQQKNQSRKLLNEDNEYYDGQLRIISFQIQAKNEKIINYICIPNKIQGKVLANKLKQLKVPPKLITKLIAQGSLTLQDGTVVKAEQIKQADSPSPNILILHYNSIQIIQKIANNIKFMQYIKNPQNITDTIIHIIQNPLNQNILQSKQYSQFLSIFSKQVKHMIYNRNYTNKNYDIIKQPISKHLQLVSFVNKYFPLCMPNILQQHYQYINKHRKDMKILQQIYPQYNMICYKRCHEMIVVPKKNQGYILINEQTNQKQKQKKQYIIPQNIINYNQLLQSQINVPQIYSKFKQVDPKVVFLGTGSMKPSKYRNVSSIYIQMKQNQAILLDCGEGSYYQLFNHFGYQKIDQIILNIKIIFITHIHSDHNLGILDLISQRNKLLHKKYSKLSKQQYNKHIQSQKLYLIIPYNVLPWFDAYVSNIQYLPQGCNVLFVQTLLHQKLQLSNATVSKDERITNTIQRIKSEMKDQKQQKIQQQLQQVCLPNSQLQAYYSPYLKVLYQKYALSQQYIYTNFIQYINSIGVAQFLPVHVDHCPQSFAIVLTYKNGIKISYSGDCRPSKQFAKAAHQSTLMIHQATFGDDLLQSAVQKMHSTVGQAIDLAMESQSWKLALTHFSQRYIGAKQIVNPSLYKLNNAKKQYALNHSIVCFDHLRMKLSQLPMLAYYSRKICQIFPTDSQE